MPPLQYYYGSVARVRLPLKRLHSPFLHRLWMSQGDIRWQFWRR